MGYENIGSFGACVVFSLGAELYPGTIKQQVTQMKYSGHKPSNLNPCFDSANSFKVNSIFSPWISSTDFS